MAEFVRRCPEAIAWRETAGERACFALPEPGMLEGVKSKGRSLLRMRGVTFAYPSGGAPALDGVSVEVTLQSRVAVLTIYMYVHIYIYIYIYTLEPSYGVFTSVAHRHM